MKTKDTPESPSKITTKVSPLLAKIGKKSTVGYAYVGDNFEELRIKNWIDTGNYLLNCQISGDVNRGIPGNKIVEFAGPTSTGKTFFSQEIVKSAQKQGFDVIYYDTEGAQDLESLVSRGIDINKLMLIKLSTVQELNMSIMELLKDITEKDKVLIVLDSIGQLGTSKEKQDIYDKKETKDMTRAQGIKAFTRLVSVELNTKNIPLIIINHTYANLGYGAPLKKAGGSGMDFTPSCSLILTKKQDKAKNNEVIGAIITVKTDKSRLSRMGMKTELNINFTTGLSRYSGLLEYAMEGKFVTKGSNKTLVYKGNTLATKDITKDFFEDLLFKDGLADYLHKKFSYSNSASEFIDQIETESEEETETEGVE